MAMSDRMQSMEEMTKALIADSKMSEPKTKDRSITTTEKQVTMSDPDMFDDLYQLYENEVRKGYKGSFNDFLIDRREADVDIPVAGEFEDMLMKMYNEAVNQGYKGTFYDFLIDRMDTEFDPSSPMRVSKLPEGIMQLIDLIDRAIENGSLDPQDRDEVIQMFLSNPKLVLDNKAGGGMMNINDMTRPLSFAAGGPIPPEPKKEKENGIESMLMDFIMSKGIFAPSKKKFDTSDSPILIGQETDETIGEVKARPKKPNEVDRQQIYVEVMNFVDGKISEDEFFNRTGFYLPQIDGVRGGGDFRQVFNTLMIDLDKRGYTGLAGTSLLPSKVDD